MAKKTFKGDDVLCKNFLHLRGEKILSHMQTGSCYRWHLEVLFNISNEHSRPFYVGVPLPCPPSPASQ